MIRHEIQKCKQFRFDWFFRTRSPIELQRRVDTLVRLIEKDMDHELYKSNKTQKTAAATAGATESKENSAHTAGDSTGIKRKRRKIVYDS